MPVRWLNLILLAALVATELAAADEIADGRKHWAFQPLARTDPPNITDVQVRTPVDRFLLARLHAAKLSFSPEADRSSLIRRATLDLSACPDAEKSRRTNRTARRTFERCQPASRVRTLATTGPPLARRQLNGRDQRRQRRGYRKLARTSGSIAIT